jgi:hypothetical protein
MLPYNIAHVINFFIRILRGEKYRKVTADEARLYTIIFNIIVLLIICLPLFKSLVDEGNKLAIWIAVMAAIIPSTVISFWAYNLLPVRFIVSLNVMIMGVVITLAILGMYEIYDFFTPKVSLIGLGIYIFIFSISAVCFRAYKS